MEWKKTPRGLLSLLAFVVVVAVVCMYYLTPGRPRRGVGHSLSTSGSPHIAGPENTGISVQPVINTKPPDSGSTLSSSFSMKVTENIEKPTTPTKSSTSVRAHFGHLLSVNIEQQLSGALNGYSDLSIIGEHLNLSAVEPYIHDSNIMGVPNLKYKDSTWKLGDLFDMNAMGELYRQCASDKNHRISTFEEFLEQGAYSVIFVVVLFSPGNYRAQLDKQTSKLVEIDKSKANGAINRLNSWSEYIAKTKKVKLGKFSAVRAFAMDGTPKKALHLPDIINVLGSAVREQVSKSGLVTVLFDNWRAVHTKPDTGYFYYIPEFRRNFGNGLIPHSQSVISTSLEFSLSLNDSKKLPRIGIHIRAERLLMKYKSDFPKCLDKADSLLRTLNASKKQVRVIHDLGPEGTKSCGYGDCRRYRSKYMSEIKKRHYNIVYYNPKKFPSHVRNRAFSAFVEREYLASSDELVTLGHGGFQASLVDHFKNRKAENKDHLYRLCSEWA